MTVRRTVLILAIAGGAAFFWWRNDSGRDAGPRTAPATAVTMTTVRSAAAPVQLRAVGSVISPHSVQIRAQVSGPLDAIYFEEGDTVAAGDRLFRIDPAPYEAAVAQARAQLALDRAAASAAQAQFERLKPLAAQEYVTPQEFDDARAAADESAARVQASAAALRSAEIDLSRTLIRAPIAGRTGAVSIRTGNLVTASDATPLLTINEVERLQVQFSLPQRELAAVRAALQQGTVPVEIAGEHGGAVVARGQLVFIDNAIRESTGTVTLKAQVEGRSSALWPGAFVEVTLILRVEPAALLVPETAVQPGADGAYVFVVGADSKAELRHVVVDRQVGRNAVIREGLKAGETIVDRAPRNLRPGSLVRAVEAAATPAAASPAAQP